MPTSIEQFHPLIAEWFQTKFGAPTDVQEQAWPRIASGEHLLITAPTGSGKTLTAFLWAINQFVTGELETGQSQVVYISPLKALNNDISRNLTEPLQELRQLFAEHGAEFPDIRVGKRSGDTDPGERRRMQRHPPEILITTPESLNLLLSSQGGQSMLHSINTLILDEIHSIVSNKRGVHLVSAVERLVPLSGEFQRLALSATVKPMQVVAEFVAGYTLDTTKPDYVTNPHYCPREMGLIESDQDKVYQVQIRYPTEAAERAADEKIWDSLAEDFCRKIETNRSTLLFTNSRALCEKLTKKINDAANEIVAYSHHGSMSRELRGLVETKLKQGDLAAIVATSTLEMGIDIGDLDEVVLIQTSGSISSAIQRIGRAGHQVGVTSKGTIYPTHPLDFIEAAVLARAIQTRDIEAIRPIHSALDVLAQIVISMTGIESWDIDELFVELRRSSAYHNLTRTQYDLVLNMLTGRYAESRIRELKPRAAIDHLENTIRARTGALMSLYLSGGVIPDRGYFQLRHSDSNARIGELDEEFVWEAEIGKTFTLGTQHWQITKITHNDVFVVPGRPVASAPPFWKSESINRDFHFSERIGNFLEEAEQDLDGMDEKLVSEYQMDQESAEHLAEFLKRQRAHTGCSLPNRHHLVVERIASAPDKAAGNQIVLHTGWGGQLNRPYGLAMEAAWRNEFGQQLEIYVSNECLVLQLPHEISTEKLLSLVSAEGIESLLRTRLEGSGFFGARFRECAGRALLLSKGKFGERKPLWMSRLQSQKLMDSVLKYEDFPILLETWRTCLQDEFDLENLGNVMYEIDTGIISWTEVDTVTPSPMAQNVAWGQIGEYMYKDDSPKSAQSSRLREDLLQELVFTPGLRPSVHLSVCTQFLSRRQRVAPGYSPANDVDLLEWIKERSFITPGEWEVLLTRIEADHSRTSLDEMISKLQSKVVTIESTSVRLIAALENVQGITDALDLEQDQLLIRSLQKETLTSQHYDVVHDSDVDFISLLENWLQYYGPVSVEFVQTSLGVDTNTLVQGLTTLVDSGSLIVGDLIRESTELYYCDSGNFESLLRLSRHLAVPEFEPRDLGTLPGFLHNWQHVGAASQESLDQLVAGVDQLRCYPAAAHLWETEYLPARVANYDQSHIDLLFQSGDPYWIGSAKGRTLFCFPEDLDLLDQQTDDDSLSELFPDIHGRYDLSTLMDKSGTGVDKLSELLWSKVWQGTVTNDSFMSLRKGIENSFTVPAARDLVSQRSHRKSIRRGSFSQWKNAVPFSGNWYRINYSAADDDLLVQEEQNKERIRLLLDRYGIMFRELLQKEATGFQWSRLFRTLRLMELSGEVLAGYFFKNIPGPQFISHEAFRLLQKSSIKEEVYWLNATDPISLAGIQLSEIKSQLPRRIESNHLVYRGSMLVLVSERNGRRLVINKPADDPDILDYFISLKHLLYRSVSPLKLIRIELINGEPARSSAYLDPLGIAFDLQADHKEVTLRRSYLHH